VNPAAILLVSASRWPAKPVLRFDGVELSYRALDVASARVAGLLREEAIEPGERVALMVPANVPEFAILHYGILRAGGVVVPIDIGLGARGLASRLSATDAKLLFAWHAVAEEAEVSARAAGGDCLFVTPGEFRRLLAGFQPWRTLCDRARDDAAVILADSGAAITCDALAGKVAAVAAEPGFGETAGTLGALSMLDLTCLLDATVASGGCLTLGAGGARGIELAAGAA
jgi:long-chain acyl-CoA synthetase